MGTLRGVLAMPVLLWLPACSQPGSTVPFYHDVFAKHPDWSTTYRISPGTGIHYLPCVHPAGTHVAFCGATSGPPRIWEADLATGKVRPLTPADRAAMQPSYSWDGAFLVFSSDRAASGPPMQIEQALRGGRPVGGPFDLYKLDRSSGEVVRLTNGSSIDFRPTFSPDGKQVVFISMRDAANPRLWRVAADGSRPAEILLRTPWAARPWFAGDGASVFFHTGGKDRHHIRRLWLESDRITPLASNFFERTHGAFFDPVTETLLVHGRNDGPWGLWELPLDGGPAKSITPAGFESATHVTRSRNGVITFDRHRTAAKPPASPPHPGSS